MALRMTAVVALVASVLFGAAAANYWPPSDPTTDYLYIPGLGIVPDKAECLGTGKCQWKTLTCPKQCKTRLTSGQGPKACFIDCSKCEATCKHRKPNCSGYGSLCYDPRLVGGDGVMFYFHGEKDQDFCLVSDRDLHINAHFIGLRPEGRSRDYTWVQSIGLLFSSHKFSVGAKKVAQWDDEVDQLVFSFDGEPFAVEEEAGSTWVSQDGQISVERTYKRNTVEVRIHDMLSMLLEVVPISPQEDKAHNYQLPKDDVFAHLDIQMKFYNLSTNVNGLLGKTYQPGYVSPAKVGVMMPVLGGEDRFFVSDLLTADCRVNRFLPGSTTEEAPRILMPFRTECSDKNSDSGMVCRR